MLKFAASKSLVQRAIQTYCSQTKMSAVAKFRGQEALADDDPEIYQLIKEEKQRQTSSLELIASENFISRSVLEALGSCLTNKYSAGSPGHRSYPSNEVIDQIELVCQQRALKLFELDSKRWGVNVQSYAGSPANMAAFVGLLNPQDRIMGLDAAAGGHSTHGTIDRNESFTSKFFQTMPYYLDPKTHLIDYDALAYTARLFRPKLIVAGTSSYTRLLDYKRFREICDDVGAILMGDMAHISGMVAAKLLPSPFEYCDVVTSTTHKTLRGPRAGMIFFRKGTPCDFETKINFAVYPLVQGGPHNNTVAALAVALRQANSKEYQQYQRQVLINAQIMCQALKRRGYKVVTDGTDNHMVIVDLRPQSINGQRVETVCKMSAINLNYISCPGENTADPPTGIRVGSSALTTRQLSESDFEKVVEFLDAGIKIALKAQNLSERSNDSFETILTTDSTIQQDIHQLKTDLETFLQFPMAGQQL